MDVFDSSLFLKIFFVIEDFIEAFPVKKGKIVVSIDFGTVN